MSTQGASGGATKAVVLIGLVLLVGAAGWWGLRDAGSSASASVEPTGVVASQSASLPSLTPTAAITQTESTTATQPSVTEREQRAREERRRAAVEKRRQQAEREQAAADQRERLALAQTQQRAERAAQQKAAQEAAARAQPAQASTAPAVPPPLVKTVEQTCASSGNFFAREVCRFQSCGEAAFFNDPVCIRFRQVEAANRRQPTN
ncbi:hypothetical protein [Hydrogenophaga sp.]|uniref:hypothetical protein n=1 Tax=Hydrogenophaga sp. TaxID=1904254 RepID=UPI0025BE2409|nr:hypothetical protein [Hydrogenophaga sp.]